MTEQDEHALDIILTRVKDVHGVQFRTEVLALVEMFPQGSDLSITDKSYGDHKSRAGTKVRGYNRDDDFVYIELGNSSYLRFKHNQVKPSEETDVEE